MDADSLIRLGQVAGALAAVAGLALLFSKGIRWMLRTLRKINDFLDDWNGEAPRHGVPERPGVMTRLQAIEDRADGIEARIGAVLHEVKPNGGSSMRDEVQRIAEATGANDNPTP
jgi:hypothetical protein